MRIFLVVLNISPFLDTILDFKYFFGMLVNPDIFWW